MARCIDCGICGFYIDLFRGLRWYEMDRTTRRAFLSDKEHNPPGHNPGTGHWNKIMCAKYLQEWADLDDNDRSRRSVMESLLKDRDCNGFAEYRAGLTPQEHPLFSGSDDPSTPKQLDYDGFLSHSSRDDE